MRTQKNRRASGMSLVETMIALTITSLAVAGATAVLVGGSQMIRRSQVETDAHDRARSPLDYAVRMAHSAGFGASGGVMVSWNGTPTRVNPVFGTDGTGYNQSDELWMIVPDSNAFGEDCVTPGNGAGSPLVAGGKGSLKVRCASDFVPAETLLVTNRTAGALLTNVSLINESGMTPGTISYNEQGLAGFSDAPGAGDFKSGDLVLRASVIHFYVALDPATNQPALWRSNGQPTAGNVQNPFDDVPNSAILLMPGVEDLQVAYGLDVKGTGNPDNYLFQNTYPPQYTTSHSLRALRMTVVATGAKQLTAGPGIDGGVDGGNSFVSDVLVENKTESVQNNQDWGQYRSYYQKRVELVNLLPTNL